MTQLHKIESRTANSIFSISGVSCAVGSFVVNGSAVHRMNICAEKADHLCMQNVLTINNVFFLEDFIFLSWH